MRIENTWVRFAGIAKKIRELQPPPHWRFEVSDDGKQYHVHDFRLSGGSPTAANNMPGTDGDAREPSFLAWIAYYVRELTVDSHGTAHLYLAQPPADAPNPWAPPDAVHLMASPNSHLSI